MRQRELSVSVAKYFPSLLNVCVNPSRGACLVFLLFTFRPFRRRSSAFSDRMNFPFTEDDEEEEEEEELQRAFSCHSEGEWNKD